MSISDQKSENFHHCHGAQNTGTKRPKSTTELQPCNQDERIWSKNEKSIQVKLLGFYKTKTKKSGLDSFSFFAAWANHDTVTDAGRATTFRQNFKLLPYKQKFSKMKKHEQTWFQLKSVCSIQKNKIYENITLKLYETIE